MPYAHDNFLSGFLLFTRQFSSSSSLILIARVDMSEVGLSEPS